MEIEVTLAEKEMHVNKAMWLQIYSIFSEYNKEV